MMYYIIEYLVRQGQLTALSGSINDYFSLGDDGSGVFIAAWSFPETKPTSNQLQTVQQSAGFQTYLAERHNIIDRKKSMNLLNTDLRRFAGMLLKVINKDRKQWTDLKTSIGLATSLADLKTRVATLDNMPQLTIQDIKSAMDSEDA